MCVQSTPAVRFGDVLRAALFASTAALLSCAANSGSPVDRGSRSGNAGGSAAVGGGLSAVTANGANAGASGAAPLSGWTVPNANPGDGGLPNAPAQPSQNTCAPNALDLNGCPCDKPGATRACYTADPVTRNVGACKDGVQTCGAGATGAEFGGQWGACKDSVVPTQCTAQLDARCVGKVGCADEQCFDALGCTKDAGMPDAGNPKCHQVMGFGFGTGLFPDGGMWCER